ncbi:hypothetical protein HIM_03822 [Hirsutella minnesotensis 3608]|uniref:Protein artemis n=1 Tax=Hirsutella minnesotensis 3608 TaxID=1043627 RepID=A0A0F7ZQB2_9HYPO|nr:hypothetical protein HIM_03822 [Hirsutella minnesotensis 3608]
MSTFNGIVAEFPDIRIDFFRKHPDAPPPLACFLSHVHSDHLAGLESLRSPFVYCSAATREILLRLERYPCRINYAKGVLEARQQTYKHLARVLKPLPLETPTTIELRPGLHIQATLFDANHCPGAVMFLIEGNGKSILYTGDVRAEPWFVTNLTRNPFLIEYTHALKSVDKIYLDTSFTSDMPFQTKAQGIAELLGKVRLYPKDTVFHFQAWTYGYEDVWLALSKALQSPIHVDDYKLLVYGALRNRLSAGKHVIDQHISAEAASLTGHTCGNTPHPGCLTSDTDVRLHSCERGNMCAVARSPNVVIIQPIITRLPNGQQLAEAGVGGGGEDLEREAELAGLFEDDPTALAELLSACKSLTESEKAGILGLISQAAQARKAPSLSLANSIFGDNLSADLAAALRVLCDQNSESAPWISDSKAVSGNGQLPKVIHFPYSRHSSYPELCELVNIFQPRDVWPCTVNPKQWMIDGISIQSLFGQYCSGTTFEHDLKMASFTPMTVPEDGSQDCTSQVTNCSAEKGSSADDDDLAIKTLTSPLREPNRFPDCGNPRVGDPAHLRQEEEEAGEVTLNQAQPIDAAGSGTTEAPIHGLQPLIPSLAQKRKYVEIDLSEDTDQAEAEDSQRTNVSIVSTLPLDCSAVREGAYRLALANAAGGDFPAISLLSTDGHHTFADEEL